MEIINSNFLKNQIETNLELKISIKIFWKPKSFSVEREVSGKCYEYKQIKFKEDIEKIRTN